VQLIEGLKQQQTWRHCLCSLGEVLKAYAKEVIRQQPADIFDFSAQYFAQLDQQEDEFMDSTWQVERDHVFKLVYECSALKSDDIDLVKLREVSQLFSLWILGPNAHCAKARECVLKPRRPQTSTSSFETLNTKRSTTVPST
jgi:hypothetical protein